MNTYVPGRVIWFNAERGDGFITIGSGGHVYFHACKLIGRGTPQTEDRVAVMYNPGAQGRFALAVDLRTEPIRIAWADGVQAATEANMQADIRAAKKRRGYRRREAAKRYGVESELY